jgi:hypothetical protein
MFGIVGLSGLPLGLAATDIPLHDTNYVVGQFHYIVAPGTLLALCAGTAGSGTGASSTRTRRGSSRSTCRCRMRRSPSGFSAVFHPQCVRGPAIRQTRGAESVGATTLGWIDDAAPRQTLRDAYAYSVPAQ